MITNKTYSNSVCNDVKNETSVLFFVILLSCETFSFTEGKDLGKSYSLTPNLIEEQTGPRKLTDFYRELV
jgi:hypothetical protein